MYTLNVLNIGFLLFCVTRGLAKGVTKESFAIAGVFCGFYFASTFYLYPAAIVVRFWGRETAANLIGFFLIFLFILFLSRIGGLIAAYALYGKGKFTHHRIWGGVLGLVKGILIGSVVIIALIGFAPRRSRAIRDLMLFKVEGALSKEIVRIAPEDLESLFHRNF